VTKITDEKCARNTVFIEQEEKQNVVFFLTETRRTYTNECFIYLLTMQTERKRNYKQQDDDACVVL
jgi:hypothetical protein